MDFLFESHGSAAATATAEFYKFFFPPPPLPSCFFQKSALVVQRVKLTACTPLPVIWPAPGRKKKKSEHVPGEKSHGVARHIPVLIVGGRGRVVAAQPVTAPQAARRRPLSAALHGCRGHYLHSARVPLKIFFHHCRPPLQVCEASLLRRKASSNFLFIQDTKQRSIEGGGAKGRVRWSQSCLGAPRPDFNKYKCFRTSRLGPPNRKVAP